MKYLIAILFLIVSVQIYSQTIEVEKLSLEQAIKVAREQNRSADNAQIDIDIADKKVIETIADGLPQIESNLSYQNYLKQPTQPIPAESFGGKEGDIIYAIFGQKQNASAGVTLRQKIFDGSYIVGLQSAKIYKRISEISKSKVDLEVRKAVIDAYVNVLLSEKNLKIIEQNLKVLDTLVNQTEALYHEGFIEQEQVEQLTITQSEIKNSVKNAARMKSLSYKVFNLTIGSNLDYPVVLTDSLSYILSDCISKSSDYFNVNMNTNINYQIATGNRDAKKALLKLEYARKLPTIDASFNASYAGYSNTFTFFEKSQRWIPTAVAGVSVRIPVFSSFKGSARIKQSKMELIKAENDLEQTQDKVLMELERAKSNYFQSIDDYITSKDNLYLSERIYNKNQIKFTEGMISSIDLKQTQSQFYQAQGRYLQSIQAIISNKAAVDNLLNKPNY